MEREYAQAVVALSQKPGASADDIVRMLVEQLKSTGREKLLPRIGLELSQLNARAESFGELLEVASESERSHAEKEAKELGITAKAEVNPLLVRGWRARVGSRVIDRSGKRALLDLYREIVTKA